MPDHDDESASDPRAHPRRAEREALRDPNMWNRYAVRMVLVCIGLMIAQGAFCLLRPVDESGLEDLLNIPMWCVIAWIAMQGPGRYLAMLGGLVYFLLMLVVVTWLNWRYRPDVFSNWDTFWEIDLPVVFWFVVKGILLFRLASLLTGLEIVGATSSIRPRWGIRRWLLLMGVIAIGIEVVVAESNWMVDLAGLPSDNTVGPPAVNPLESARSQWLVFILASLPLIPILPVHFSGWMFAGKRWRFCLLPILGLLVVLHVAGVEKLLQWVELQSRWFGSLGVSVRRNWALVGILGTIAYGFAASLIPWLGCRWIDYWTPMTRGSSKQSGETELEPSALATAESLSTTLPDQNDIPKTKSTER